MPIVIKQIREGTYYEAGLRLKYTYRIYAVGKRTDDSKLQCPVLDFFKEQKTQHPAELIRLSALLEHTARYGPPRNPTKFKHLEGSDGIFEFKEYQQRLLCFWDSNHSIICTNGIVKKSERLPKGIVDTAKSWKDAYFDATLKKTLRYEPEHQ